MIDGNDWIYLDGQLSIFPDETSENLALRCSKYFSTILKLVSPQTSACSALLRSKNSPLGSNIEFEAVSLHEEWCIGCGVCVAKCPTTTAQLDLRPDKVGYMPTRDFAELHERILEEKGLK